MAITVTIILVPYHLFKPMQLIWRSGTHWFHLRVPNLQVNWELDHMIMCCSRIVAAILAARRHAPLFFNTLRARQHGCHFADDIFKCIFLNENVWISIRSSLKFVPTGPIYNIPAMVQITAWRWPGDKPLSQPTRTTRTPAFWDTPRRPMITHTSDSHQIPSQNKTKSKLQILKNCQKFKILHASIHATHLLKLPDKMYKYKMDPTRTVGATERTRDAGRMDGRSETSTPPTTSLGIMMA